MPIPSSLLEVYKKYSNKMIIKKYQTKAINSLLDRFKRFIEENRKCKVYLKLLLVLVKHLFIKFLVRVCKALQ